tara:strand:- start:72712 stop:72831 length:120 start_codon:yes stop_codon:yes gene_type:complete
MLRRIPSIARASMVRMLREFGIGSPEIRWFKAFRIADGR